MNALQVVSALLEGGASTALPPADVISRNGFFPDVSDAFTLAVRVGSLNSVKVLVNRTKVDMAAHFEDGSTIPAAFASHQFPE